MKCQMIKNQFRKLKQRFSFINRKTVLADLLIVTVLSAISVIYTYVKTSYVRYITVSLNYSEGRDGLNPEGGRFNIADIKNDEVIEGAIKMMGNDSLTVDNVKPRITIDTVIPKSSVDNVIAAISDNTSASYSPSEFDVYYSQKNKFAKNETETFLKALADSYTDYFQSHYAHKNNILKFDIDEDMSDYDYNERYQRISDKIAAMQRFLDNRASENNTFKSDETGYTYGDIVSLLNNVKNGDLEKLKAYIMQNKITKDKSEFMQKNDFLRNRILLKYNTNADSSRIAQEALSIYNPYITSVAYIPSVDKDNEFYMSRTKTGLDTLVNDSYSKGATAIGYKKTMDEYEHMLNSYSDVTVTDDSIKATADQMIVNICDYVSKISDIAIKTDNEFLKEKNGTYISFYYHPKSKKSALKKFIVNMVFFTFILCIATVVYMKLKKRIIKLYISLNGDNDNEA